MHLTVSCSARHIIEQKEIDRSYIMIKAVFLFIVDEHTHLLYNDAIFFTEGDHIWQDLQILRKY